MKINTISTYILVCLLTHGHWNLLVPVKAAGEDATSTVDPDGTVASTTADGANEGSVLSEPADTGHITEGPADATPPVDPSNMAQTPPDRVRLFKDDCDNNAVEMVQNTDFEMKNFHGNDIYRFKDNVKCISVKFGDKDVWKKGDNGVNEPKYVAYGYTFDSITVREGEKSVFIRKDATSEWKRVSVLPKEKTSNNDSTPKEQKSDGTDGSSGASTEADGSSGEANEADGSTNESSGEANEADGSSGASTEADGSTNESSGEANEADGSTPAAE